MATIVPFKGIRPTNTKVHLVPSLSVDTYKRSELKTELENNPFSFLQVIHPDFNDANKTKPNTTERFKKIRNKFQQFITDGILIQDEHPSYYIYQQQKPYTQHTGIIACASVEDYLNGTTRVHEQTFSKREETLKQYLEVCELNAAPVVFSYPDDDTLNKIIASTQSNAPSFSFETSDKVNHKLWVVNEIKKVLQIQNRFLKIEHIYIADGHHRSAASSLLAKSRNKKLSINTGKEAFNYYLGVFFPETQLSIFDYNRVIKDLNSLSVKDFIKRISDTFIVTKTAMENAKPTQKRSFSMYLDGEWYLLKLKDQYTTSIETDSTLLSKKVLEPILNITNIKNSKHLTFVAGTKGMDELKMQVDRFGYKVAFGLFPLKMEDLKHIADTNKTIPPKTTWIEPKIRSGLVMYSFSDKNT